MKKRMENLLSVANNTKVALLKSWDENGNAFIDKNKMKTPGMFSESIGLTSLMLMLTAFYEEKTVISDDDIKKICEIHKITLKKVSDWIDEYGFSADPVIPAQKTKKIFSQTGYIDAMTWVLSTTVFTRYLAKNKMASFDKESIDISNELMVVSLKGILESQRDDGTWGFIADKDSNKSLYFTYSVSVALADVLDYILGELTEDERAEQGLAPDIDTEMLKYLDTKLGYSTKDAIFAAREKIQNWLLKDCLVLMPKLAQCSIMDDSERNILGVWNHYRMVESEYAGYYNLFYTYYLLDMMVSMKADKKFEEWVADSAKVSELRNHYKAQKIMSETDLRFYFGDRFVEGNPEVLWKTYIEESIHASRANYMAASRTGNDFWNMAELDIHWKHDSDTALMGMLKGIYSSDKNTDPTLVPSALRANTLYSFYISNRTDIAIDRLYDDIVGQAATEDSSEAIVDYYDYLMKFSADEDTTAEVVVSKVVAENPVAPVQVTFDGLIEAKIAEYLMSDKGQDIIRQVTAGAESAAPVSIQNANGAVDIDVLIKDIEIANRILDSYFEIPERNSSDIHDRLAYALFDLSKTLSTKLLQNWIGDSISDENECKDAMDALDNQFRDLSSLVAKYHKTPEGNIAMIYSKIIEKK